MKTIWKPIFNNRYEISNSGMVRSIYYRFNIKRPKPFYLTPHISTMGYYRLAFKINGMSRFYYLHRLMGIVFIPNPNNFPEVAHLNGDPLDCRISNLKWVSHKENQSHKILHKTLNWGENHYASKMTLKKVLHLRNLYKTGEYMQKDLSKMFNMSRSTVCNILNKKRWKHI